MPSTRTLVKAWAGENCIGFKTVSWDRKSLHQFLILREHLEGLVSDQTRIVSYIHSFASLSLNDDTGMLRIEFTWLNGRCGGKVDGWEETVTIPYDALVAFMQESCLENGPKMWRCLSTSTRTRPKLVFCNQERLRECVANKSVRRKLGHALRDNFNWPNTEQVHFYRDSQPYSFAFCEIRNGCEGMVGGLILHNYENNLKKAYYGIHT